MLGGCKACARSKYFTPLLCLLLTVLILWLLSPPPPRSFLPRIALRMGTARFGDPATWCTSNVFLRSWSALDYSGRAASLVAWRGSVVHKTHEVALGVHSANSGASHWQYTSLPEVRFLGSWQRYGTADGGKWISGLANLRAPCVVYSLGSDGDLSFEEAVTRASPCEVHTLDCTLTSEKTPRILPERVHFHALCLGDDDAPGARFRSLRSIMAQLGHSQIDLLKVDIEGFEYRVVEALFRNFMVLGDDMQLPHQLLLEQHAVTYLSPDVLKWGGGPGLTSGDMAILWLNLIEMGYVLVHREDQAPCPTCTELVAVRAFCCELFWSKGGGATCFHASLACIFLPFFALTTKTQLDFIPAL
jgi:hypothetical protein